MKRLLMLMITLIILGCSADSQMDCFKKQGELKTKQISTGEFGKISISVGIELYIAQSDEYSVKIEAGKNFIDDVDFETDGEGELKISNKSNCELLRNYHSAKVYVTAPDLKKIHSGSQYPVRSQGVLKFPELSLESGVTEDDQPPGLFEVEVDNQKLMIGDNVSSIYKVKGKTQILDIRFWSGAARFEGENLTADEVHFFHRSSNDIIVRPISLVKGTLAGTGNLVLKNVPETVEVEQLYTGHIVYP
ncbi:MAG: head GIN domain-containing protein [Moheibacter sp.]